MAVQNLNFKETSLLFFIQKILRCQIWHDCRNQSMRTQTLLLIVGMNILTVMKISKIWFDNTHLYGQDSDGKQYCQSILWYRRLLGATPEQLENYVIEYGGISWPDLDEDISFESFVERNGVEPSPLQSFFLQHREINLAEFSRRMGINGTLLRNYVYGWKIPSKERTEEIAKAVREYGKQLSIVTFAQTKA